MVEGLFAVVNTETTSLITGGSALAILGAVCGKLYYRTTYLEERGRNDVIASVKAITDVSAALKDVTKSVERLDETVKDLVREARAK